MAGFDYNRAVSTADRLIKKFGQKGKLRRYTSTGSKANPSPRTPHDVDAVFAVTTFNYRQVDGTRVLATDKLIYVSVKGMAEKLDPSYSVVASDGEYKIVNVDALNPGGINVYYKVQARK